MHAYVLTIFFSFALYEINSCLFEVRKISPQICKLEMRFNEFDWGQQVDSSDVNTKNLFTVG